MKSAMLNRRGGRLRADRPSSAEDAGVALYEALKEYQATWDEAGAAIVEEYRVSGEPVEGPEVTGRGDRTPLFRSFAPYRSVVMPTAPLGASARSLPRRSLV